MENLPEDIYQIAGKPPHYAGFDIHHKAADGLPCDVQNGECHRISHLKPIAPAADGD